MSISEIRDRIVDEAMAVQDYSAARETKADFRDLLGPPQPGGAWDLSVPFSCRLVNGKYVTRGVSSCGLVGSGIYRRAGVRLPWNGSPYWRFPAPFAGLDIVSCLSLLGQHTSSRRKAGERPQPGDLCCIGSGLSTHVLCCVADDGRTVTSIDGGQVDDAAHGFLQRVKVCHRVWSAMRVVWVLDADKVHAFLEGISPAADPWTVRDTQTALAALGYAVGPVDGIAGRLTRAAIVAFQRATGLVPDGVVGPLTRHALQEATM